MHDPLPPDLVKMIISPLLFPGPERATILLLDFHSAESKQSEPQMINPVKMRRKIDIYILEYKFPCIKLMYIYILYQ